MLGQTKIIRDELAHFFGESSDRRADQALANQPANDLRTDDRAATTERSVA
jgi:hypothetical protein